MNMETALAKLDADIVRIEGELRELKAMRASIAPFLSRYVGVDVSADTSEPVPPVITGPASESGVQMSMLDRVAAAIRTRPGVTLTVNDVYQMVRDDGHGGEFDRTSIRNSIHHAMRKGVADKGPRRGTYVLRASYFQNASAADSSESAAEDQVTTTGAGGDPHAQADQSHHPGASRWEDDRDRGGDPAAVGG